MKLNLRNLFARAIAAIALTGATAIAAADLDKAAIAPSPWPAAMTIWVPVVNPTLGGWPVWMPFVIIPPGAAVNEAPAGKAAPVSGHAPPPAPAVASQAEPVAGAEAAPSKASIEFKAPDVDLGPVAPTPVVLLPEAVATSAPPPQQFQKKAAPQRKKAASPRSETQAVKKRRLCWKNGVVAPCE